MQAWRLPAGRTRTKRTPPWRSPFLSLFYYCHVLVPYVTDGAVFHGETQPIILICAYFDLVSMLQRTDHRCVGACAGMDIQSALYCTAHGLGKLRLQIVVAERIGRTLRHIDNICNIAVADDLDVLGTVLDLRCSHADLQYRSSPVSDHDDISHTELALKDDKQSC